MHQWLTAGDTNSEHFEANTVGEKCRRTEQDREWLANISSGYLFTVSTAVKRLYRSPDFHYDERKSKENGVWGEGMLRTSFNYVSLV